MVTSAVLQCVCLPVSSPDRSSISSTHWPPALPLVGTACVCWVSVGNTGFQEDFGPQGRETFLQHWVMRNTFFRLWFVFPAVFLGFCLSFDLFGFIFATGIAKHLPSVLWLWCHRGNSSVYPEIMHSH